MEKFYIEADIKLEKETEASNKALAAVIDLPVVDDKQPDLQYFSALFVSTGTNLNGAHFMPSELVKAENTIVSKALDVEHSESEIIGHIYDRAFIDKDNKKLNLEDLASKEEGSINSDYKDMHVLIAGVVYKYRFPNIAEEIADNKWKVSMECYYSDYDVKVGNLIMTRREAEVVGLASSDSMFGKVAKVIKDGKEIAEGKIERVLRGIMFSGCGIVKNPANPPSVILETATEKETTDITDENTNDNEVVVLNYDLIDNDNKLTSNKVEADKKNTPIITDPLDEDTSDDEMKDDNAELQYDDTVGICVNYKRRLDSGDGNYKEDWCTRYDSTCTSFSRDTTDPDCLRNKLIEAAKIHIENLMEKSKKDDCIASLVDELAALLKRADNYRIKK